MADHFDTPAEAGHAYAARELVAARELGITTHQAGQVTLAPESLVDMLAEAYTTGAEVAQAAARRAHGLDLLARLIHDQAHEPGTSEGASCSGCRRAAVVSWDALGPDAVSPLPL